MTERGGQSLSLGLIEPRDHERVSAIARVSDQMLDLPAELERSWAKIWVAREKPSGPAIGFLLAWSVADELHVVNVATDPDFRRRGAGSALLSRALEQAARDRARVVLLEVRRSNQPAIGLYRAFGFSVWNVRRGYYRDNEDAIEMKLDLDPATGQPLPGEDDPRLEEA